MSQVQSETGLDAAKTDVQPEDRRLSPGQTLYGGETKSSAESTCENFKLELLNLPVKPNFHVLKSALEKQFKIQPQKIRLGHKRAYIAFRSEKERDDAIEKLNNKEWKGRTLTTQVASPREDSLVKRRKLDSEESANHVDSDENNEPSGDEINNQVCPLWSCDYDDQLNIKNSSMRSVLNMSKDILKMNSSSLRTESPKLYEWAMSNQKISCKFDGVERSPILVGYRNKCEFNISRHGTVGFKLGRYKDGSERICRPPDNCPILTKIMFVIIDNFQNFLTSASSLKSYDLVTHEGNYRQLTVRCNSKDEYLIIADLHPQNLSDEEIESEIELLRSNMKIVKQIVSVYVNISAKCQFASTTQSLKLVYGQECLHEHLTIEPEAPLKFRIGPTSFFQVNSGGAELLYKSIIEVANLNLKTMVLDIGCGTGTIGLSLAKKVNHVIGIELIPDAIKDAKINALTNNIENVTYFAGRAEDLLSECITIMRKKLDYQRIDDGEIVAIVDPPRTGFNSSFVKSLRASSIKKIVYIACDARSNSNLLALCRPTSKAYQGDPFVPTRAKAFDLFPHTKCCELLVVYERLQSTIKT